MIREMAVLEILLDTSSVGTLHMLLERFSLSNVIMILEISGKQHEEVNKKW